MKHNRKDNAVEWQPVKQRIKWIDCAKTVAIIGVLIDHNNGLLYTNQVIAKGSYFGVSLFILGGAPPGINTGKVWARYCGHMQ